MGSCTRWPRVLRRRPLVLQPRPQKRLIFLCNLLTLAAAEPKINTMNTVIDDMPLDMPAALVFTDAAARKVSSLIENEGNNNLMLRVFVQGGGCSGMQYGFEFDEQIQDGDTLVENLGVKLLVDPMSLQYLSGAEIDYREGLEGAQFVIRNPNATTTCGCGSSFAA